MHSVFLTHLWEGLNGSIPCNHTREDRGITCFSVKLMCTYFMAVLVILKGIVLDIRSTEHTNYT